MKLKRIDPYRHFLNAQNSVSISEAVAQENISSSGGYGGIESDIQDAGTTAENAVILLGKIVELLHDKEIFDAADVMSLLYKHDIVKDEKPVTEKKPNKVSKKMVCPSCGDTDRNCVADGICGYTGSPILLEGKQNDNAFQ